MDNLVLLHGQLLTFTLDGELFIVCLPGVAWVGFAGKAGFKGDFDDDYWIYTIPPLAEILQENDVELGVYVNLDCEKIEREI